MSISASIREEWGREDRLRAARAWADPEGGYEPEACSVCGRQRVYRRADGKTECEKCESVFNQAGEREY
jgi:ribosomal protein L37AE/L43A